MDHPTDHLTDHLVALLYGCCFVLFGGLILVITVVGLRERKTQNLQARRLRRIFVLLALSLMVWQATYLLESCAARPVLQLSLGRTNFAVVALTVYLAMCFIQEIAHEIAAQRFSRLWRRICLLETVALGAVTWFTPLVDAAEWLEAGSGRPISRYGLLFPLYLFHLLAYLAATLILIDRAIRRSDTSPAARKQLTWIGIGICTTGAIAIVTNAALPYFLGDFRFCDAGILSTLVFVLAVAYAIFVHGLFDLRVVIRETLVYGTLLALILGAYSTAIYVVTQYLTEGANRFTQLAVLMIAFSCAPLKRFLEKKVDRLLFSRNTRKR